MANHEGYVFIAPDGKYLQRSKLLSHGTTGRNRWWVTPMLDCAFLFPNANGLDNIRHGEGFEALAEELKIGYPDFAEVFTAVPAHSIQKIVIGRGDLA